MNQNGNHAPIIQVNNDYYTELTPEKLDQLLDELV